MFGTLLIWIPKWNFFHWIQHVLFYNWCKFQWSITFHWIYIELNVKWLQLSGHGQGRRRFRDFLLTVNSRNFDRWCSTSQSTCVVNLVEIKSFADFIMNFDCAVNFMIWWPVILTTNFPFKWQLLICIRVSA